VNFGFSVDCGIRQSTLTNRSTIATQRSQRI
jgi:hypothetical protein